MQVRDNIELMPNIGFGIFEFSIKEKTLLKFIGEIGNVKYEVEKRNLTIIYDCHFSGVHVLFFFHYNRRGLNYLSIHTSDLTLNKVNLRGKKFSEVISIVREYHNFNEEKFEYSYNENDDEVFINFKNIGLSIWFESDTVSDISCQKVD